MLDDSWSKIQSMYGENVIETVSGLGVYLAPKRSTDGSGCDAIAPIHHRFQTRRIGCRASGKAGRWGYPAT